MIENQSDWNQVPTLRTFSIIHTFKFRDIIRAFESPSEYVCLLSAIRWEKHNTWAPTEAAKQAKEEKQTARNQIGHNKMKDRENSI